MSPLMSASVHGHHKVAKLLVGAGANVNARGSVSVCVYIVAYLFACAIVLQDTSSVV